MQHSDAAHIHIGNELTQQRDSKSVEFGGGGWWWWGGALALGRPTGRLARQSFGNLLILSGPL